MNLNVLYEDNHVIVVEKPSGILSQADHTGDLDLLSMVKDYVKIKYNKPNEAYIGLVHRLDRSTSGIMVFARTSKAASRLSNQIRTGEFKKKYYAVVQGIIDKKIHLEDYLIKNEQEVKSYVTNKENGKLAILDAYPIKVVDGNTLVSIDLFTGRHHQIRVQMANISRPLVGDSLYSNSNSKLMLHAYYLQFIHPTTKEELTFNLNPSSKEWDKYLQLD